MCATIGTNFGGLKERERKKNKWHIAACTYTRAHVMSRLRQLDVAWPKRRHAPFVTLLALARGRVHVRAAAGHVWPFKNASYPKQ